MKRILAVFIIITGFFNGSALKAQTPELSGKNFFKDGTGNIINLSSGIVYKDLGDGTLLNLNSGELYKRISDGTIIKLETDINVPIKIK